MQQTITLGSVVQGSDGPAGHARRLVINPNTSRMEYVIVHHHATGAHDHFVPIGLMQSVQPDTVTLTISVAQMQQLPPVESRPTNTAEGTVQSNVHDLLVVSETMLVYDQDDAPLGNVRGVVLDDNFRIERLLLHGGAVDEALVQRLVENPQHALVVHLGERTA